MGYDFMKSGRISVQSFPWADPASAGVYGQTGGVMSPQLPDAYKPSMVRAGYAKLPSPDIKIPESTWRPPSAVQGAPLQLPALPNYQAYLETKPSQAPAVSYGGTKTTARGRSAIDAAKGYLGQNRYAYGSFDCSKFVQEVAAKSGVNIPRSTGAQIPWFKQKGKLVDISRARPGDLVFLKSKYSPSGRHVGVYIGDGKMIDNAGRGKPVAVRSISGRTVIGFGQLTSL